MRLCPSCGAQLPGSARFCGKCGHLFDHARTARSHGAEEPVVQADASVDHPSLIKRHARQPYRYLPLSADAQAQPGVNAPPPAIIPPMPNAQSSPPQLPVGVASRHTQRRTRRRMSRKKKIILWSVLVCLLMVSGGVAYGAFYLQSNVLGP